MSVATQQIVVTAEEFLVRDERGYAVLRVRTPAGETLRAVGLLADIPLGAECELVGRFEFHRAYGRQFSVSSYSTRNPTSVTGIERFLASGWLKGVGPKTARRLVAQFGLDTLDVLAARPHELASVPGLSRKLADKIGTAFAERQDIARLGSFLRGHDLPMHLAEKLARTYGSGAAALRMLQTSPYQAAEDVRGIGFKTADGLALAMGMSPHAHERIGAALLHVLSQAQDDGHMFLPQVDWVRLAAGLAGLSVDEVSLPAGAMAARGSVVFSPIEAGGMAVYDHYMHRVESNIVNRLREVSSWQVGGSFDEAVAPVEDTLTEEQRRAARAVFSHSLVVLTGGPGTGKTTTMRAVVGLAKAFGLHVALAAPTGRAAKRLTESAGEEAVTLHRLLEVGKGPDAHSFARSRTRRLDGDLFIVDEASMIDAPLFSHLLDALPDNSRLLLVGDPEQLPSVGPGQILKDVIASGLADVHELGFVFRQAEQSAIIVAAHAVRQGRMPSVEHADDYYFIAREDAAAAADLIVDLAAQRLPNYLGLDAKTDVQVLCPMKKGLCGIDHLNVRLSERLSVERAPELRVGERVFRTGDKVMNIKNDYERDIYNGDIGLVAETLADGLRVRFGLHDDGRDVSFARSECGSLVHAYAVSVHKSQGSEYPCVVIPLVREHAVMLYRQLLYTAMTRAKSMLVVVGSPSAYELAVRRADAVGRFSRMAERLRVAAGHLPNEIESSGT